MRKPNCKDCHDYQERLAIILVDKSHVISSIDEDFSFTAMAHALAREQCCVGCTGENGIGLFDGK